MANQREFAEVIFHSLWLLGGCGGSIWSDSRSADWRVGVDRHLYNIRNISINVCHWKSFKNKLSHALTLDHTRLNNAGNIDNMTLIKKIPGIRTAHLFAFGNEFTTWEGGLARVAEQGLYVKARLCRLKIKYDCSSHHFKCQKIM